MNAPVVRERNGFAQRRRHSTDSGPFLPLESIHVSSKLKAGAQGLALEAAEPIHRAAGRGQNDMVAGRWEVRSGRPGLTRRIEESSFPERREPPTTVRAGAKSPGNQDLPPPGCAVDFLRRPGQLGTGCPSLLSPSPRHRRTDSQCCSSRSAEGTKTSPRNRHDSAFIQGPSAKKLAAKCISYSGAGVFLGQRPSPTVYARYRCAQPKHICNNSEDLWVFALFAPFDCLYYSRRTTDDLVHRSNPRPL